MKLGDEVISDAGLEKGSEELAAVCCCLEPLKVGAKGSTPPDECELLAKGSNDGVIVAEEACLGDSANGSNEGVGCLGVLANGSNEGVGTAVDARRG